MSREGSNCLVYGSSVFSATTPFVAYSVQFGSFQGLSDISDRGSLLESLSIRLTSPPPHSSLLLLSKVPFVMPSGADKHIQGPLALGADKIMHRPLPPCDSLGVSWVQ